MKKIFSLFAAILFAGGLMADDVLKATLVFSDTTNVWNMPADANKGMDAQSFTDGTYTITLQGTTGGGYRVYPQDANPYLILGKQGASLTFQAFTWKTTKIVVTGRAGASTAVKQNIFVGEDAVSTETTGATGVNEYVIAADKQAAGTIYALKVNSNHNTQITKIEIYTEGEAPKVATPVISGDAEFTDSVIVTMTCSTEDADIYYTIDGTTDPKCDCSAAPEYKKPIVIKETTTIKAAAYTGNDWSAVATKTFTKVAPLTDPTNCAEAAAAALSVSGNNVPYNNGKEYTIEGFVTAIETEWSEQYKNITFWMADTKDGGKVLEAFRAVCETAAEAPVVGDAVSVTGKLTKYNTTPEFAAGCTFKVLGGIDPWKEIIFTAATAAGAFNDSVFAEDGFKLTCIDTDKSKIKTTANDAAFGDANEYAMYKFRLQTGGKSGSKNSMKLTIPGDGYLRIAVRTGSNDDVNRTVVLSQGTDTLYNKVVKEADAVEVPITDSTKLKVYPYITVPVKKGEVAVGYPVNAVNFYSFAFLAGAAPDTIPPTAPDTITCAKAAEDALAGKTDEVVVKGYVTEIATEWSAQYKNISFWMADAKDGGKVFEAFRAVCEKEADAPIVGDLVAAAGKLTKYNETPELAAGCTFTIIEKAPRPEPKPTVIADTITVAKAIELGMKLDSMATDTVIYAVEGYVINAGSVSLTYMNQSYYMADAADAAASDFQAYNCYAIDGNDTLKVLNGDKVQLVGKLKKYYNKTEQKYIIEIEKGNASFISKTEGDHSIKVVTEEVTVAQALEIGAALADNAVTEKQYKITAYVSAVNVKSSDAYSDQYGNQSFWVADDQSSTASTNADGAFYVYRGKPSTAKEIALGSKVEFTCTIKKYVPAGGGDPVIENADQNILITVLEEPAGPELPDGVISCDSAVALAKTIEDPVEVKSTVEGPQVKVWGYVTYAYNASEKDGIVTQSAWLSDVKDSNSGVIQGAYLEIASMEAAVVKGDYVQLEGTLAKYLKEGKDGKPNEIVIEVINGKMAKVSELGIENIELTVKAQKVIVDGVLYIIRDNKMYNVQGLQVR